MANPAPASDGPEKTGLEPDRGSFTGTPRWVKLFGVVALVLVLAFVVTHLSGKGFGHGGHVGSGEKPSDGEHGGHTPPVGGHP